MSAGLGERFNILKQSPHDLEPIPGPVDDPASDASARYRPSRYNIRAVTADGRLVLWNSYWGTMSVFGSEQRPVIEALLTKTGFEAALEGVVSYLHGRGFIVKEGTDEYRRVEVGSGQQHFRTDTLQLILLASEDCNFRCDYCYEDFARGTMQPWVRTAIKALVTKRLPSLRSLSISWFGGEPLYGFAAIEDLAPFLLETSREHSLGYSANMTTNGYLLTPEVADKLLSWNVNAFQITLDGIPEDHDRSRPTRDGQGTFATIIGNLMALKDREGDFKVDVRVNFDRKNAPRLPRLLDLLQDKLHQDSRFKLRFRAVGQWGGPNDPQLEVCGPGEASRLESEMKDEARRRGLPLADGIRQVEGLGAQVCYAARPYNFIVGASGKLMKCTIDLDKHDRNVVGRLTEQGDMEIDFDKFALWTEPAYSRDTKCQKCVVLPVCQGVFCPQIRIETGESPCTPLRKNAKAELRAAAADLEMARKVPFHGGVPRRPALA